MSTQIQQVAEHAKKELEAGNNRKTEALNKAVAELKADVAFRDNEQDEVMTTNAKAIAELEDTMQSRYDEYSSTTAKMIAELTSNEQEGIDSVSEVVAALIAADALLDTSMLQWGVDAEARKATMIAQIGNTVDVSA